MTIVTPIFDKVDLLPKFLTHYTALGVNHFVFGIWQGCSNPIYEQVKHLSRDHSTQVLGLPIPTVLRKDYNGIVETRGVNHLLRQQPPNSWVAVADMDEFVHILNGLRLCEVLRAAEEAGHVAVRGSLADRVTSDYSFPKITNEVVLDEIFPLICDLTRMVGANAYKVSFVKAGVGVTSGHHNIRHGTFLAHAVEIHHFKWTEGLVERLQDRYQRYTEQGLRWRREAEKTLSILKDATYLTNEAFRCRQAIKLGV